MIKKILKTGLIITALLFSNLYLYELDKNIKIKKTNVEFKENIEIKNSTIDSLKIEIEKKDKAIKEFSAINLNTAKSYLGTRYVYGGYSRKGIDCSGLVCKCTDKPKVKRLRTAHSMFTSLSKIKTRIKGALVFFKFSGTVDHVGIILDSKRFIHASASRGVVIDNFSNYSNIVGYRKV